MKTISIIREYRNDEKRTPLIPKHVKILKEQYPEINIIVQPAKHRCFKDEEYKACGAIINEDLSTSNLILGVKEVESSLLIPEKKYLFFSHTSKIQPDNSAAAQGTPGMDKKELLREILKKNITLIDYENIRDHNSTRYLGFGRFAGIVGCYNSLNLYLETINKSTMPKAYELNNYEDLKKNINQKDFSNARIILTGDGRVARGAVEFLKFSNIRQVSKEEFLENNANKSIFCNLSTSDYVKGKDEISFNLKNFIENPHHYTSVLPNYMPYTSMLISAHYWDPKSPRLLLKNQIQEYKNLKVIGDITCDVNGSIPSTSRASTIKDPYYYVDRKILTETEKNEKSLAVMAVDNLPSELPKDSSEEFGDGIVKEVLPFILNSDDGRITKATIAQNGTFMDLYKYLNNYINAKY